MLLNELVVFSPRQTQAEYLDSAAPSLAESLVSLTCVPPLSVCMGGRTLTS